MWSKKHIIGIIGFGAMGHAIANRLARRFDLVIFDKDFSRTSGFKGAKVAANIAALIDAADTVILAVKPQHFPEVFEEITSSGILPDKLVVSIAAGIPTEYIESHFGVCRVIRVMPNMPAKIGAGMTCLCKGKFASNADLKLAKKIFRHLGKVMLVDESMMNAATAISGNGPGYVYYLLEKNKFVKAEFSNELIKQAGNLGFSLKEARLLAHTTVSGALKALKSSGLSAHELKNQVTSKGGMTEAALKAKESGASWEEAIKAAVERGQELAKR
ncbi:MAG: pyrroline-5-carboxylate reductase [Candidatus Omnitrophica bacterium]|nr:pyrroline-5-carboxylate reductase [Candidatus Omnitrophota bacterium]